MERCAVVAVYRWAPGVGLAPCVKVCSAIKHQKFLRSCCSIRSQRKFKTKLLSDPLRGNKNLRQGVELPRSRRFLGGLRGGFLRTLGVGVGFFVRLRKSNWIISYITLLTWEFLLKWYSFFWNFYWNREFLLPLFPLIASCYKIVDSPTSFTLG